MEIILTHENADFDAVASLLAAHKLNPEALPVLPERMNQNVARFIMLYQNGLPFVRVADVDVVEVKHVTVVDTQRPSKLRGLPADLDTHIIDHHPLNQDLVPNQTFSGEVVGAATTLLVEKLNPSIAPLDNTILIDILRRSLNTQAIVTALEISGTEANVVDSSSPSTLRTELANAGWPDGLKLILAYTYTPGAANVVEHLQLAGIQAQLLALTENEVITAFSEGRIQAALISWKSTAERENWVSRFGDENVLDLYRVPISYVAVSELNVEFTPNGWPIPAK